MNDDGYFDKAVAETYDAVHGGTDPAELGDTVDCLLDLSSEGRILEFAIGTGRIALPLVSQGGDVSGIELSQAMVDKLRDKETDQKIDITIGDMTTAHASGPFSLVYLVFNTIDNLTTQDAQVACFENAARHLETGGRFVVETLIPPLQKLAFGERMVAFSKQDGHFGIDDFDVATQRYSSNHIWMSDDRHKHLSIPFRYVWPSELDLMARIAGMELEHRWADWRRSEFDGMSTKHISVWRKRR